MKTPRIIFLLALLPALFAAPAVRAAAQPNFLIIMADDCTFNDLPVYGGKNAQTPNIDQLAKQGLTFNRAYLAEAMCQPCRAELYSGQYPLRNGCAWNHSASRPTTKSLPHYLRPLGYRVGLSGKGHVKPQPSFPFFNVKGFDINCVRNPTQEHDLGAVRQFIAQDHEKPFCLVVALVEPHVPWVMGDASQYPPKKIKLPPNLADTPRTRDDYGKYLAEITYMDGQVGEILQALEESGQADNTIVLFTSEQGSQFPGCKWTNWDTGIHTALITRWPGKIPAGKRTDAIVQYVDVAPTLVAAAGGDPAGHGFDGSSFLPVLNGQATSHRNYAYGIHNNLPEGPAYPIRTVTNGKYRYIRNLLPDELYIEKHLMGQHGRGDLNNPYWATWIFTAHDKPATYNLVKRYMSRPAEQLYLTAEDPYEMNNLAADHRYAKIKAELSAELDEWMASQGDPGAPEDTLKALAAARRGNHLYVPPSQ
jgi:N-sulfoglucosamine sulfohydrolase